MKLILLDRDGVINRDSPNYVKTPEEWIPIEGSLEAIAQLYKAGWHIYVVSNQSVLGRGLLTINTLISIHEKMQQLLSQHGANVDALFFCPHRPEDQCRCRKPRTALLEDIALRLQISLVDVPFVGDTEKDINAAKVVGARPMLVRSGQGNATLERGDVPSDVPVFDDLLAATRNLLQE